MQVDWLTVAAQWVNFLILVLLLKRYLYGPVIRAMDRRQQAIEATQEQARQQVEQAEREAMNYRDKIRQLEDHKTDLFARTREEAARERERLMEVARAEVDALTRQWRREIDLERQVFQDQVRQTLGGLVVVTARKALEDLASLELEQALVANFLQRLGQMREAERRLLADCDSVTVASSPELSPEQRQRLADALAGPFGSGPRVKFEPLPDSALGLVLMTSAYTLEWRLEHYFDNLKSDLETALKVAGTSGLNRDAQ